MSILKRIGTSQSRADNGSGSGGRMNQNQDNPTTNPEVDELNGLDPSYAGFVKETQQGVSDFVNGHYVPPSAKGSNYPDGYIS